MVHGKKKGMKKKYKAGEATQYISRKHARKKLQVKLLARLSILLYSNAKTKVNSRRFSPPVHFERNLSARAEKSKKGRKGESVLFSNILFRQRYPMAATRTSYQ